MKVLIIYENINREYDNCLLLKVELEKRGYSVVLKYKTECISFIQDADLTITPNCYTIDNEKFYRYVFAGNKAPILSLQYEQVFTKNSVKNAIIYPVNELSNVYFIAWGREFHNRLVKIGFDKSRIKITGAIQLDFCRKEFNRYYLQRKTISKIYNLNNEKKWILFISSLTMFPQSPYFKHFFNETQDIEYFMERAKLQVRTQKSILDWFERFLRNNDGYVIIYRRHPVEESTRELNDLIKKYTDSFVDITDLSVKQWIKVCDYCCNWLSTSAVEIAEFNKPIIFLRPHYVSENSDYTFLKDIKKCTSYDDFSKSILFKNSDNYLRRDVYEEYYNIGEKPAYIRICDYIDEIIQNKDLSYRFERKFNINRLKFYIKNMFIIKLFIKKIYQFLYDRIGFRIKDENLREKYCFTQLEYSSYFHKNFDKDSRLRIIKEIINS